MGVSTVKLTPASCWLSCLQLGFVLRPSRERSGLEPVLIVDCTVPAVRNQSDSAYASLLSDRDLRSLYLFRLDYHTTGHIILQVFRKIFLTDKKCSPEGLHFFIAVFSFPQNKASCRSDRKHNIRSDRGSSQFHNRSMRRSGKPDRRQHSGFCKCSAQVQPMHMQ